MPTTDPGELRIQISGQPCLTVRVESARAEEIEAHPNWQAASIAWDTPPTMLEMELWIGACMPENGTREPYDAQAGSELLRHRLQAAPTAATSLAWANPDAEYPGAVTFDSVCATPEPPSYAPLTDDEIGDRLYEAWRIANKAHKGQPSRYPERRTSLSGMRGKIGLARIDGRWLAPMGSALSTWIAKHEDSRRLRGEAGIESLCQEAMRLLGVPAANTLARVFGGQQSVLSERCDRHTDPVTGEVRAVHQEDFAQTTSWPGGMKYDAGSKHEPRWPAAYALLQKHAAFTQIESEKLTRMLAAMWMLGHGDLHRRNLGFTHFHQDGRRHIRLAPMYDVSSAVGTYLDQTLAIGIARQNQFSGIGFRQWRTHAEQCGLPADRTIQIAARIARNAPDAIATARDTVRTRDENRHQASVDRRAEELLQYAERRRRVFINEIEQRERKTSSVEPSGAHQANETKPASAMVPPPPRSGITF